MNKLNNIFITQSFLLAFISAPAFASGGHDHDEAHHVEQTQLSAHQISASGLRTEQASQQLIQLTNSLFGVIEADQNKVFHVYAPYLSRVEQVHVRLGEQVKKGQKLLTLMNIKTLQRYSVKSVATGVVTERTTNPGDRAERQVLLTVTDLSQVWVELSAFPESIEKLKVGQKVTIYDLHQHEKVSSEISYIAPVMTGGHIARARAIIDNPVGHWRPGMHIKADITVAERLASVAVKLPAIQTYMNKPTVFVRTGNTFKPREVKLGIQNSEFVEILSGLTAGERYVTNNSFLIKADILKSSASHDH